MRSVSRIDKVVTGFRRIIVAWNLFWWNHHVTRAREHDARIERLAPGWRRNTKGAISPR